MAQKNFKTWGKKTLSFLGLTVLMAAFFSTGSVCFAKDGNGLNLNQILSVAFGNENDATKVLIETKEPVGYRYTIYDAVEPYRVVVDFPEMGVEGLNLPDKIDNANLQEIRVSAFELNSGKVGRLEFLLKKTATYDVSSSGNTFGVTFSSETVADEDGQVIADADSVAKTTQPEVTQSSSPEGFSARKVESVVINQNRAVFDTDGLIEKFRYFGLKNPQRLVLDIYGVQPDFKNRTFKLENGFDRLRVGPYGDKTRFVFDATGAGLPQYNVQEKGNNVVVSWDPENIEAPVVHDSSAPLTVESLDFMVENGKSLFIVTLSGPGELIQAVQKGNIVRFGVKDATIPRHHRRAFDSSSFPSVVQMITPYNVVQGDTKEVRFAAELKGSVPYSVAMRGEKLIFEVENGNFGAISQSSGLPSGEQELAMSMPQTAAPVESFGSAVISPSGTSRPSASMASGLQENAVVDQGYSGEKISLVFDDADIRKIFNLIGEVSNLNIIVGDEVKGTVSLRLIDVPWDQALDLIMEIKGLGMLQDGNVVRILPKKQIRQMDEARYTAARTKEKLENLATEVIPVSYTDLKNIETPVKKVLSERGNITLDDRNKQIIVTDIPTILNEVKTLVRILDTPERQVMIEARIVEASSTFGRQLGVKWGISNDTDDPSFNVGLGGSFLIPPPAIGSVGSAGLGSGITFGNLGVDSTIVDLRISALESSGHGKIVSKPRVATLNGETAKIAQGTSIPYSTVSDSGTKTEFIDANLELEVTPVINPDNTIILEIKATNNQPSSESPDLSSAPAIDKKEAETKILVRDGETTVIGGIFVENETSSKTGVPFLMNVPVLGHLFKSTSKSIDRRELLIFITPKILE
jgi:type IV pilus assembly protein PilQ